MTIFIYEECLNFVCNDFSSQLKKNLPYFSRSRKEVAKRVKVCWKIFPCF